ncbi:MAG: hypothetical protein M3279_08325 [Actinomycetota bacterium]|nr:hypothetical protein [Actinomycetota bacterium]
MGGRTRTLLAVAVVAGLAVVALPQGASAAGVKVCLEQNSYSFNPPLDVVPTFGSGGFSFSSDPCASVTVNEGGNLINVPQPGPGASGGFGFTYFGGCALTVLDGGGAGTEVRVIVGGVVQAAVTNQGSPHVKVGVLVPDFPCPISSAAGPAVSVFAGL